VVQTAANAIREIYASAHCDFNIDIQPGLPRVQADPDALVTVLLNLLENAHKYTREDKRICLRAYCEGSHVVFAVEDNGIGIATREHKRIFRRFYQVDRRLTRETGGCGLGLTIVDFIVRAHGGLVRVRSELGGGSAFHVMLPCAF
jgi:two-component system, OmpR family, phosphate regulon sensor histidine kinase PhoR